MDGDLDALEIEQGEIQDIDEEQDGETEVTLEGEEPSDGVDDPNESAVIRDFRKREREKDKELRELRQRVQQPAQLPSDPGARPKLEDFDYDDDKHGEALDVWIEAKGKHDAAVRDQGQRAQQIEQGRRDAYQAAKAAQPIAGIDAAEQRVFDAVPEFTRNALLHAKSPALIAVLDKYPDRLSAIVDMMERDPVEGLMMIGELKGKAKVMPKRPKAPDPEEIPVGTASVRSGGTDKHLEKLEKAAEVSGDRTEVNKYKRTLRQK